MNIIVSVDYEELFTKIDQLLRGCKCDQTPCKLVVKNNTERGLVTATTNLYYPRENLYQLNQDFEDLNVGLLTLIKKLDQGHNEIILQKTHGYVLDQSNPYFVILQGIIMDSYLYDSQDHLILRLSQESAISDHALSHQIRTLIVQPSSEHPTRHWISLDIDLIRNSLWFAD